LPDTKTDDVLSKLDIKMSQTEERPSKIRRLDSGLEDEQIARRAPLEEVGSLESISETISSAKDDVAKATPPASRDYHSLNVNSDDELHENRSLQPLSKNKLKKLLKKQTWEEGREYRKAKRREKVKQKKSRKAEARATAGPQSAEETSTAPELPKETTLRPVQLPITFVLDCDFDDLMTEGELISLGSQLTRCYSDNRSAPFRAHLVVSSFGGKLKHRFETVLASNHLGWKGVKFTGEDFVAAAIEADAVMRGPQGRQLGGAFVAVTHAEAVLQSSPDQYRGTSRPSELASFRNSPVSKPALEAVTFRAEQPVINGTATISTEKIHAKKGAAVMNDSCDMMQSTPSEETNAGTGTKAVNPSGEPSIVYLTSDSSHTLDVLSPYTTYVIGGIVDKNRHKGICYKRAMARNIPTAKLPIGEYMTMQSRSVLATNHVAEIMIKWLEYGDWAKAFLQVIPKRKEARLKSKQETADDLRSKNDGHAIRSSQGD
jgi:tRNA (guanine9-N1)-methyltransferase